MLHQQPSSSALQRGASSWPMDATADDTAQLVVDDVVVVAVATRGGCDGSIPGVRMRMSTHDHAEYIYI
jgi:hypothetical protein